MKGWYERNISFDEATIVKVSNDQFFVFSTSEERKRIVERCLQTRST